MKKMLIVEEPESCETCPLRSYSDLMLMCTPMREPAYSVECPLKPIPMKEDEIDDSGHDTDQAYVIGWNDCIDEILGETKNETVKSAG